MSVQNTVISNLLAERARVHSLRISLLAHLRSTGNLAVGNNMIQEYLDSTGLDFPTGPDYLRWLPDLIGVMKTLIPLWRIERIHRVNTMYAVALTSTDGRSYDCKYVAKNLMNPLAVAIITARLFDIGKILDDFEGVVTKS